MEETKILIEIEGILTETEEDYIISIPENPILTISKA